MHPFHVLIVKTSAIGDVLQTMPVAKYLKKKFPKCSITWVIEKKHEELLQSFSCVDQIVSFDLSFLKKNCFKALKSIFFLRKTLRALTYDVVFDLQGNCKSALVTMCAKARTKVGFNFRSVAEWPNLLVTSKKIDVRQTLPIQEQYIAVVKSYYQDHTPVELQTFIPKEQTKTLMICPGSFWSNKQLSQKTLTLFLEKIHQRYGFSYIFIWGSEQERALALELEKHLGGLSVGCLKWDLWQDMMKNVDAVISVDSCALHLAALNGIPTFSCFGPSSSAIYKPLGESHRSYQGSCPYQISFVKRCPYLRTCLTGACIKEIACEDLEKAFEAFWLNLERSCGL